MDDMARMIKGIEEEVELTRRWIGKDRLDPRVMQAMAEVPRHEFIPAGYRASAYYDGPVPIGHGQTISQPYIVALMTDLLEPEPGDVVLEIGTGCGYQAAILSRLVAEVYSVEIVSELAAEAAARLRRLGYDKVAVKAADGYEGWREKAPFDGIIVTAAAPMPPTPLIEQLRSGGNLVIPLGAPHASQMLTVVHKSSHGEIETRQILPVAFVPFTGALGGRRQDGAPAGE